MIVRVNISDEVLKWIITHVDISSLSEEIQNYLHSWSHGEKKPTFNQIEKTSKATGIPLGYFFLETPPNEDLSLINYRTVDSFSLENPSRNLIDTMHDMELIQDWTRNYLLSEGASKTPFVGAFSQQNNILNFADSIRKILNLSNTWFNESEDESNSFRLIRKTISDSGVIVMVNGIVGNNTHRSLDINEFRAFAIVDEYAPLIFINSNDSINGKLFSLLHEFVHICIGENSLFNDRYSTGVSVKKTETICNNVAAEVLVPQAFFVEKWNSMIDNTNIDEIIQSLSKYFKCSMTVIARRALDNGFIDYPLYEKIAQRAVELYNAYRRKQKSNNRGGDFYRTAISRIDPRFFKMLTNSVAEGKTLYSDAFRLTNTNRSTFTTLTEYVGGSDI